MSPHPPGDSPDRPPDETPADAEGPGTIFALVYDELRRLAAAALRHERSDHTLQPTALVHEAYLRLASEPATRWENRSHFMAVAARAMRRILVDYARKHRAVKRGSGAARLTLDHFDRPAVGPDDVVDLVTLDDALSRLASIDPRQA